MPLGTIAGGIGAGMGGSLGQSAADVITGGPGARAKEAMDQMYPNTNPWERLGAGGGGAAGAMSQESEAKTAAASQKSVARTHAQTEKYKTDAQIKMKAAELEQRKSEKRLTTETSGALGSLKNIVSDVATSKKGTKWNKVKGLFTGKHYPKKKNNDGTSMHSLERTKKPVKRPDSAKDKSKDDWEYIDVRSANKG